MTAETPMIMPSIVSPVRILLRLSAFTAIRNVITGDMLWLLRKHSASAAAIAAAAPAEPARAAESTWESALTTASRLAEGETRSSRPGA